MLRKLQSERERERERENSEEQTRDRNKFSRFAARNFILLRNDNKITQNVLKLSTNDEPSAALLLASAH